MAVGTMSENRTLKKPRPRFSVGSIGLVTALAVAAAALFGARNGSAASSDDPNWPCIQRKVPEISAGMVWAGPPTDEVGSSWRKDAEVAALAAKIAARGTPLEDAKGSVTRFAEGLNKGEKDQRLTLLFAGTLQLVNGERSSIINGIGRFTRRQQGLAKKIEAMTGEINQLAAGGTQEDAERRRSLEEQLLWDTRIYEEREKQLVYICEQPVLLEQRVFALSREIMNNLD